MFGNAIITPVPNYNEATQTELIVWGLCLSLAVSFAGWLLIAILRGARTRVIASLLAASFVFLSVGCIASTRGHVRIASERMKQNRDRQGGNKTETEDLK